jgi:hypothetical protein
MIKSCFVQIRIGDIVKYRRNEFEIIDVKIDNYALKPNGINNPELVCIITATSINDVFVHDTYQKITVKATSDNFFPLEDSDYTDIHEKILTK